jgi:hypothetical protein
MLLPYVISALILFRLKQKKLKCLLVLKLKFSIKLKIFVHDRIGEHHPEEEPDLNPDDVKSDLKNPSKVEL